MEKINLHKCENTKSCPSARATLLHIILEICSSQGSAFKNTCNTKERNTVDIYWKGLVMFKDIQNLNRQPEEVPYI
jgi:hypothetical protein